MERREAEKMSKSKEEMTRSLFLILGCVLWIQGGGFRVYGVLKGFVFTVLMDGPWVGFRGDGQFQDSALRRLALLLSPVTGSGVCFEDLGFRVADRGFSIVKVYGPCALNPKP